MTAENVTSFLRGRCSVFVALDLGFSVDLLRCLQLVAAGEKPAAFKHNRKAPIYFDFDNPPLVLNQSAKPITIGKHSSDEVVTISIFEFGAISVAYSVSFDSSDEELIEFSELLYDNRALTADARSRAEDLLKTIRAAVKRPYLEESVESYVVFELWDYPAQGAPVDYLENNKELIAKVLGSESKDLSGEQVDELLNSKLSYYSDDLAVITWNAALLFGADLGDVKAALEFANVQLLEIVHLDSQLDRDVDAAYSMRHNEGAIQATMQRIGELTLDGQFLFDAITNALKLIGDPYLARVYSMALRRFGLVSWYKSIESKLAVLQSLYTTISNQAEHRRSQRLEVIVILLIFVEIVLSLVLPH